MIGKYNCVNALAAIVIALKINIPIDLIRKGLNSFKGVKSTFNKVNSEVIKMKSLKEKNQPMRIKTGGSTFKNPINQTNKKVWELIRESVSIDTKFGDAHISEKHSNFFVNKGNATFNDMKKLIDFVSKKVLEKTGIKLDKEIKILE